MWRMTPNRQQHKLKLRENIAKKIELICSFAS